MEAMDLQADIKNDYTFEDNSLIHMDQFTIHRVGEYLNGPRAFLKVCFSKDKYNLLGNSINHELDYEWEYVERKNHRNVPQQTK